MTVHYRTIRIDDVEMFYREAGPADAPVILLLHGFPTSSHMFRDLIPLLSRSFRLIAPDLPGFGQTVAPDRDSFAYTFDNLAQVVGSFTDALGLASYALYVFDYGAPVGFRVAMARPERVTAIIDQNGNAYLEGLHAGWATWEAYWRSPSPETREACRESLSIETIRDFQYLHGTDPTLMSPDNMNLDLAYLARPGVADIQLDLILDYRSNVALYPAFHAYFRTKQPPFLVAWGKNDASFRVEGALAFRTDLPNARIELFETGHFALETHAAEIAAAVKAFLPNPGAGLNGSAESP